MGPRTPDRHGADPAPLPHRRRRARWRAGAVALGTSVLVATGASAAPATPRTADRTHAATVRAHLVAVGPPAALPRVARRLGPVPARTAVTFEVVLPVHKPRALATLVRSVTTPGSPTYHHYLARGAFARRFGATPGELATVEAGLARLGLAPVSVDANRLAISVRARADVVERALSTPLVRVALPSGATAIANLAAPRLPAALAAHVGALLGLDTTPAYTPVGLARLARPALRPHDTASAGPMPSPACLGAPNGPSSAGFTADQIAAAYGLSGLYAAGDLGASATVALVEFSPFLESDITTYAACYGSTVTPAVSAIPVDGGPGNYDQASEVEAELDIEDVVGLVPSGQVLVYEGPNSNGSVSNQAAYDTYARVVADDRAQVISTSWGGCEQQTGARAMAAENVLFEQAALQGQSVVAASGDSGSEDCYSPDTPSTYGLAVDDPASQPFVTGVGGTTLTLSPVRAESVWNTGTSAYGTPGATGGGLSAHWPMPAYQADTPASLGVLSAGSGARPCRASSGHCRAVPDVAANAGAPYAVYCTMGQLMCSGSGWTPLGGTSAAAPTWAAVLALANASSACQATGPVGFANPALYAIAGSSGYLGAFGDVTSGNNDLTGTNAGSYPATPGYDLATGLGTPVAGNGADGGLVAQLCGRSARAATRAALPLPAVTKVTPSIARSPGGAVVALTGSMLLGVSEVRFGPRDATRFHVVSATRLIAVVPPGSGAVHVTVRNAAGTSRRTRADVFHYLAAPRITRLAPPSGPARGGNAVVLIGAAFAGARTVRFGGRPALGFKVLSPTRILAVAPPGAGVVLVAVTTAHGASARTAATRYRYRG